MAKRDTWTEERRAKERAGHNTRRAAKAREAKPWLPPYTPRAERGPLGARPKDLPEPYVPDGHELHGVSKLTKTADGAIWDKTKKAPGAPHDLPPGFALPKRLSRFTGSDGGVIGQWASYDAKKEEQFAAFIEAIERHAEQYAGLVPAAPGPARTSEQTLVLYPIGDHHLGMLAWAPEAGEHWDLRHGKASLVAAMTELVRMAPDADRAIIANLGDFLHAQDDAAVTPGHGNKLDVDGRHAKVADAALLLLTTCIDLALRKHRHVTVRNLPGNHDPRVASALARELRAWYRNEPRVDIADAHAMHQYDRFGNVLLGFHHGDRTPGAELPAIMAVDEREAWGQCEYCYWHVGHVHHKVGFKEHPGAIVEAHRILPPGDAWHAGRYRAGRGMSFIVYDRDFGEVGRATIGIAQLRATIAAALA